MAKKVMALLFLSGPVSIRLKIIKKCRNAASVRAQLDILKGIGCDFGQGYLFSKPIDAESFQRQFLM